MGQARRRCQLPNKNEDTPQASADSAASSCRPLESGRFHWPKVRAWQAWAAMSTVKAQRGGVMGGKP